MSLNLGDLYGTITVDDKPAVGALKKVQKGFDQTGDAADKAQAAVDSAASKVSRSLQREADALGAVRVAEAKMAEVRKKSEKGSSTYIAAQERLESANRKLVTAQDDARSSAGKLAKAQGEIGKGVEKSLDGAESKMKGFGAKGAAIMLGAGVAIGAALSAGVLKSMDVGKANDKLAAQLGLNAGESEAAGRVAGSLYANAYGGSLEEVNGAVGAVMSSIEGMRTASEADVEAMTAKVLDLSAAFEIDAGRAAQVAGQMITSGLAEDGVEAADLLTAALQRVPAAVREDVLDAVDEYGPFMANLGISGEKGMGMLVAAAEDGMYGIDKTGDALKEFGIRATDMSEATGTAYGQIGLDQGDMTAKLLAGGDSAAGAFDDIVAGVQGIKDPVEQSQAALALFGTPLEDLSVTEIPKFLESLSSTAGGLGDVAGAADNMGTTLNDNAATKIETFKRTVETAIVGFFADKVLPIFEEVIGGVTAFAAAWKYNDGDITSSGFPGFMERVGYWARQAFDYFQSTVLPVLVQFGTYLLTNVLPAVQQFGAFLAGTVVPALVKVARWVRDNTELLKNISLAIGVILIPALVRWGIASTVNGAKAAAAWVVAQTAAARAGVVYVAQSALIVARWVAMSTAAVLSGAKTAAVWTGSIIAQAVKGAVSFGLQVARVVAGWVLMGVQSLLQAARMAAAWLIAMGPIGWVTAAVIGIVALVIANWDKISKFTAKVWGAITGWVTRAWANIKSAVSLAINWVQAWIAMKMLQIQVAWDYTWKTIRNFVAAVWDGIKTKISDTFNLVKSIIDTGLSNIKTNWSNAWNWVKTTASNVWGGIKTVISGAWAGVKSTLTTMITFVRDKIGAAFEKAKDGIATAWNKIQEVAKKPVRFVVDRVINEGLIGTFNGILGKVGAPKLPTVSLPKGFATGGLIPGNSPSSTADNIPIMATANEYMVRQQSAMRMERRHPGALDYINNYGKIPGIDGYAKGGFIWPVGGQYPITQRPSGGHPAYDIGTPVGSAVKAAQAGRVALAGSGYRAPGVWGGNEVHIDHGGGVGSLYAHLNSFMVRIGEMVKQGQTIAASGNTGISSGPHLHFGALNGSAMVSPDRYLNGSIPGGAFGGVAGGAPTNPFDGLIDILMGKIKTMFPGGGMFVDAAGGLAKTGIGQVVKMVTDIKDGLKNLAGNVFGKIKEFFGGGAATAPGMVPTLMDGGGWLKDTDGPQLVDHRRKKKDAFTPFDEWKQIIAHAGSKGPTVYSTVEYVGENPEQFADRERRRMQDALSTYA